MKGDVIKKVILLGSKTGYCKSRWASCDDRCLQELKTNKFFQK